MIIREVGIISCGIPIIFESHKETRKENVNLILNSGLLSSILSFAEITISPIEYFQSNRFTVVFKKEWIGDQHSLKPFIAYVVIDNEKNVDKYIKKRVLPLLKKILRKFKAKYNGKDFVQFEDFRKSLSKILNINIKTLNEKFVSLI
ncbi:MAG: hypothetical protein MUP85_13115 [Candidatus Lokiarchaeota archaeon]|nr:hypothetical protein [Candidatus Lokiarchaeota archaeon]